MTDNIPSSIEIGPYDRHAYQQMKQRIDTGSLHTVCMEANCPNRYECFSKGTATFMILGDICTRDCRYCTIKKGDPLPVDEEEPQQIAETIQRLGLDYAVITCVTRDDLDDYGAQQFVSTVRAIRERNPDCRIELLISDLKGEWAALRSVLDVNPDVLNHNIEVVRERFSLVRPQGNYDRSLELLQKAKEYNPNLTTKSGFMVGLGETDEQIEQTLNDLKEIGCDIVTVGQYLQPSKEHYKVKKYYSSDEFQEIKRKARQIGIKKAIAGPLVRSSYKARECL